MTYVEKKYNFKFPYSDNQKVIHGQEFGCCGFHAICEEAGFCIIPNQKGDGKRYCMTAKRNGWNHPGAIRIINKKVRDGGKNEKVQIFKKRRKR